MFLGWQHGFEYSVSSTSFGWGKGGNITSAGWQVTVCDSMWYVSSRSGVATLRTAIHLLLTYSALMLVGQSWKSPVNACSRLAHASVTQVTIVKLISLLVTSALLVFSSQRLWINFE